MSIDTIIHFSDARIFQGDHLVLNNVNFDIKRNEFVYLIGKVGSGKSSLIKTINCEIPLKEGQINILGTDLGDIKKKQVPKLRRRLGIVFQDLQLLIDRSVYDNLKFVLGATEWKNKKEIDQRIQEVLEKVGLQHKGYKMPHQLSGGEQQRVVIARALLNDPEIILADEPTGNLDPETSDQIMQLLFNIQDSGRAVIMATHNYNLLEKFPARTLKCKEGKVIEIPPVQESISNPTE